MRVEMDAGDESEQQEKKLLRKTFHSIIRCQRLSNYGG